MSFEINWEQLLEDKTLNNTITNKLNDFVESLTLPSYLQDLQIVEFKIGSTAPNFILKSLDDPHPQVEENPHKNDIQALLELEYRGDMMISLQVSLVLNYPGERFMILPVKVTISQLQMHCLCLLAHLTSRSQTVFSILCDVDSDNSINGHERNNANSKFEHIMSNNINNKPTLSSTYQTWGSSAPLQRMAIVQSLNIETEIGDNVSNGPERSSTLKNVDKLEQFLLAKFKDFIRNEIGWPNTITFDYNDDEEEESEETEEEIDTVECEEEIS